MRYLKENVFQIEITWVCFDNELGLKRVQISELYY